MQNELPDGPRSAAKDPSPPPGRAADPCRVAVQREGPFLVEGPVEVTLEDGSTVRSDRFRVALCTCRRSRRYPWCDTSHRRRTRE
ncbi:CDGSH iron-sulfur domain-containing protein [Streptomyces sp. NPDC058657]|uniref:CDGSH iron-sulfur domain-containing protein n=1 Tax=unclassified Streptomyces TaxID=2593676 RepID=UPI00365E3D2B